MPYNIVDREETKYSISEGRRTTHREKYLLQFRLFIIDPEYRSFRIVNATLTFSLLSVMTDIGERIYVLLMFETDN